MRAVERTPWAERRSSRHDEMVARVASNPWAIVALRAVQREIKWTAAELTLNRVTVEAECGSGFCDVLIEVRATDGFLFAVIVEVKTDDERASAGDTIRQLKWYRQKLREPGRYTRIACVCCAETWTDEMYQLMKNEQFGCVSDFYLQKATHVGAVAGFVRALSVGTAVAA